MDIEGEGTGEDRPMVTDHALLRWLERCHGIDVEYFRAKMAEEILVSLAERPQHVPDDHEACQFVINDHRVITVLPPRTRPGRTQTWRGFTVPRVALGPLQSVG